MPYYSFDGTNPEVHPEAHVSKEATLIGDVRLAAGSSVWPGTVCRADADLSLIVGRNTHIEDNCTVHVSELGDRILVGHNVVLDAATVGDGCLIGNGSVLNQSVRIGDGCIIAAGTVVPDGAEIPPDSFVRGVPADSIPLEEASIDHESVFEMYSTAVYDDLTKKYEDLFETGSELGL